MEKRLLIIFLSIFLLAQFCHALPQRKSNADSSEESRDKSENSIVTLSQKHTNDTAEDESEELSDRNKLLFFTLAEFSVLANFTVTEGRTLFTAVLKEASVQEPKSASLEKHIANMTHLVDRVDKFEDSESLDSLVELFDLVVEFSDIMEHFNTSAKQQPTTEDLFLETSLQKNGLDKLEHEFTERFDGFSQKFYAEMDNYVANMTEKERQNEPQMLDWYKDFRNEKGAEKKIELFAKFFDFYEKAK